MFAPFFFPVFVFCVYATEFEIGVLAPLGKLPTYETIDKSVASTFYPSISSFGP